MSEPKIGDAYSRYETKVRMAQAAGFSNAAILDELRRERATLQGRALMKSATLAQDRNIYKKREAIRAAGECQAAIDRIIEELTPKEQHA